MTDRHTEQAADRAAERDGVRGPRVTATRPYGAVVPSTEVVTGIYPVSFPVFQRRVRVEDTDARLEGFPEPDEDDS